VPGTLLRDDWQSAVEDELKKHARNLQQAAQQAQQGVQSVFQAPPPVQGPDLQQIQRELQAHAQSVAEPVIQFGQQAAQQATQAQQGVVQFGQQATQNVADVQRELQDYVGQIQFGQPPDVPQQRAAPVAATAGAQPPSDQAGPIVAGAPVQLGTGRDAFIASLQPLAARVSASSGIDPNVMIAIAANETGWGVSRTAKEQNNLFSIQGPSGRASRWATYDSPEQSFEAFVDLISTAPRYRQAWAVRNDPDRFVDELRRAGYVADEPGFPAQGWVDQVKGINRGLPPAPSATLGERVGGLVQQGARIVQQGAALPHSEEPGSATDNLGDKWKTQFGFKSIYTGSYRTGTPHRGIDIVPQKGGIGTPIEAFHPGTVTLIQRDTGGAGGLMVYVKDAEGLTHAYMHLQKTRDGLKVGDVINRGDYLANMGESGTEGSPHLHYEVRRGLSGDPLDQLIDPRPFMIGRPGVPTARAAVGSTDQQAATVGPPTPIDVPRPAAKPPLIADSMQPTVFGEAGRDRPAFQVVQDVAGEARRAAQEAAERVIQQAQDVGRQIGPNLGFDDEELRRRQQALNTNPALLQRAAEQEAKFGPPETRVAPGLPQVAGAILGGAGSPTTPGPLTGTQAEVRERINQEIEQHPAFQNWPVPVAAGVGIEATKMLLDPMTYMTWGPLLRGGAAVGRAVTSGTGSELLGKLTASGIANGLQNAMYEIQKPHPDPFEVGLQFATGAIGGPAIELGAPALARAGRRILQDAEPLLRARQRGELDLGLITSGQPTPRTAATAPTAPDVLHGQAVPRPGYEPGTPEASVEDFLATAARAQGTPRPTMTGADIAAQPGMAGTLSRGLDEVRHAIEVGLPAARWYQEMVAQIKADTGQDINPREAAVLMGAFGGNAGVPPNYHAMLSVFDAMRRANPDLTGLENLTQDQVLATQAFKDVQALVRGDKAYADDEMLARVMRGYRTGEIPVPSGAKLSSYTQDFLAALNEAYAPYSTQDVWQGRLFGARPDVTGGKPVPDVSQNDKAYRTMHALTNWVAREMHLSPDQAQAAGWTVFRALWNDPVIGPELRNDRIGLSDAIRQGQRSGVLDPQKMRTGGLEEVTAPRGSGGAWVEKINDVRERIRANGSYNTPPPASATAVNEWGLYHPSIQSAAQQRARLDPSGFQYGTVSGPKTGIARPVGNVPAAGLRELALGDQPVLRVPRGTVDVDPATGKIPWLVPEHTVQQVGGNTYVSVVGVGDDAAQVIGRRLGADRFNHAEPNGPKVGGFGIKGVVAEQRDAVVQALASRGLPVLTAGDTIRVPIIEGSGRSVKQAVDQALIEAGVTGVVPDAYAGATHAVRSAGTGTVGRARGQAAAAGRPDLPAGDRVRAAVFRDEPLPGGRAEPPGTGLRRSERGEADPGFALDLGGAVAGGYAGYAATPEDADWSERARNVGIGATTGLLGTRTLRGGGGRLAAAAADIRLPRVPEGFRAPDRTEGLLQATTGPRPPGPPREPRRLGEVHSNNYLLNEAGPDDVAMTDDELMAHYDTLEQRLEDVKARSDAIDESLRNPTEKVYRPSWAAGYTNEALIEIARRNGASAYDEAWDQAIGFDPGSGEVKYGVGESGLRGTGRKQQSPTELRAELRALQQEEADLMAAADQLGSAPAGVRYTRRPIAGEGLAGEDLPFDAGSQEASPNGPFATEAGGPSGVLADDIVTKNGTSKRPSGLRNLWGEPGQVVGTTEGRIGRAVADAEAASSGPPSEATLRAMPNLDALLKEEVPDEIRVQIQRAVEDNPELFEAYNQGRISHASLTDDLARKVGMSTKDWLATKVGQGFSTPELVALQAAAVDAQHGIYDMGREILARQGGVDGLSPEEVAFALRNLFDTNGLLAVARGARSTQGRSLNALKQRFDRTLARGITGANEKRAADKAAAQARRGATKATQLLNKGRDLEQEAAQAVGKAKEAGLPRNIWQQIEEAYAELDRYNAMSLHEKGDEFNRLAKERADRAAARKAKVREAPQELLSALRAELAAEQKIFAGRKNTWETMAFWDSKAAEIAAEKRRAFRGGLYLEQARKSANLAAKNEDARAAQAWEEASRRQGKMTQRATTLLESIGGVEPSKELLKSFVQAIASGDPMVAAKFMKGLHPQRSGFANFVEVARNSNIMRLAGMLSATATHIINMGGSIVQVPLEVGAHALTVGIDIPRAAITGGERQAYAAELGPMLRGWWDNAPDANGKRFGMASALPDMLRILRGDVKGALQDYGQSDVAQMLKTGISPSNVADLSTIRPGFRSSDLPVIGYPLGKLPGNVAERVIDPTIEMPLRALQAEDLAFRGAAMGMHAQRVAIRQATREGFRGARRTGRANNIVANLEEYPELYQEVAEAAARMIFQERRTVPGMSNVRLPGTAGEAGGVLVSQVIPFRKTPVNITAQGLGLSPFGAAGVLEAVGERAGIKAKVASGELPASRLGKQTLLAQERASRAVIGSAILGTAYLWGTQQDEQGKPKGTLTAMYDEDEASTYPQGWRAWSMRQENPANGEIVYVPLQNFGAAGVPMAMAAILADASRRGKTVVSDEKEMGRAIAGIGRYALDTPFLQGLSDAVELFHDPGRAGTKFVEGLVGSYGPYSGMGRQIQRAYGVASRNPREGWLMMLDALEANYPGLSGNVPEATTALGEPRTPGATGFGALVGRYDIERDTPTLEALRLADVNVPRETRVLSTGGGYGVELTEAERDTLKRARGQAIIAEVAKERARPRTARSEQVLRTAAPDSPQYRAALEDFNAAMQGAVTDAAKWANQDFEKQLGKAEIKRREKQTREVEQRYLGTPSLPVGELNP
jgi:murein DD-endopeptidase MepM/ murein hydrolase activator NlpD